MRSFVCSSLCALLCVSVSACTHVEYTRSAVSGQAQLVEDEFGAPVVDVEDFGVNEIVLLDTSGVVCAGVQSGLREYNAAYDARKEAIKKRRTSYSYTYNVAAPVAGLSCGMYYRWGSGDTIARGGNANPDFDNIVRPTSVSELGFVMEGTQHLEAWNWMVYTFGFELGGGSYGETDGSVNDGDTPLFFRWPLYGGVGLYPPFLFGLGVEAQTGLDFVGWGLSAGAGGFLDRIDYELKAAYQYKYEDTFMAALSAGYQRENLGWGEYWLRRQGPFVAGGIAYIW